VNRIRRTAGAGSRAPGFTLVELLVVMTVLAILLGLTAGALTRAGKAGVLDGAARVIRSGLHRARGLALAGGTLSLVTVTPPPAPAGGPIVVTTQVSRIAGSWHFDGESDVGVGGDGATLQFFGAVSGPGFVRDGIVMTPASRAVAPAIDRAPKQDPGLGFSLDLMIRPEGPGTIAQFSAPDGDTVSFRLRLNDDGSLAAEATVIAEQTDLSLQTRPKVIEMGQWARVAIVHDGVELQVTAHNVVEARVLAQARVDVEPDGALRLGGFAGTIDEVVYRTVGDTDPFEVDGQITTSLTRPVVIRFNRDGRLNERAHAEPVEVPLSHESKTVTVTVDLSGVIR
jgi:prepilin-type N-terminal cleavage/methylation domain-containing protein